MTIPEAVCTALGLPGDASEAQAVAAIDKIRSDAKQEGAKAENARIFAILGSEEAEDRLPAAVALAGSEGVTPEAADGVLAKLPKQAKPGADGQFAQHMSMIQPGQEVIAYNAIAQTTLPPDSSLLGLDAARLPVDGKAQIYRTGMLALVHHTGSIAKSTLLAGEVIDCGRPRLYRAVIEDADGLRLPCDTLYTVDREAGTVTMADPLDLTGYTAPYTLYHTVADLQRLRDVDIAGRLTCLRPLSHVMPADGNAYASGVLYIGTLQAKVSHMFEQSTWTGEWSDTRIGDQPLASYNSALYPIAVTNAGAYPDRFLVKFKTSTTFDVIGEQLGFVGSGDINTDFAPVNQLTDEIYFTIDYRGWGGSWSAGNCLRFNVAGACWPVDAVRAVQPSDPSPDSDSVELLLIGNVDA